MHLKLNFLLKMHLKVILKLKKFVFLLYNIIFILKLFSINEYTIQIDKFVIILPCVSYEFKYEF